MAASTRQAGSRAALSGACLVARTGRDRSSSSGIKTDPIAAQIPSRVSDLVRRQLLRVPNGMLSRHGCQMACSHATVLPKRSVSKRNMRHSLTTKTSASSSRTCGMAWDSNLDGYGMACGIAIRMAVGWRVGWQLGWLWLGVAGWCSMSHGLGVLR